MTRRFSINFGILAFVLDAVLVSIALWAANAVRPLLNDLPFVAFLPDPVIPPVLYPVFSLTWAGILLFFAVYDGRRSASFAREWLNLTGGSILAAVSIAGILFLSYREISRVLILTFFGLTYSGLVGWRVVYRVAGGRFGRGKQARKVLIVGGNEVARDIGGKIRANPETDMELAGYLADEAGEAVLGRIEAAVEVVKAHGVDEVVIALPDADHDRVASLVSQLHLLPLKLWVIPNYFQLALFRAGIEEFAGVPMLDLHAPAIGETQRVVKRVMDLIVCALVLIPGIPVMLLTALAVRLDSGRPVLFKQVRVGENGRTFNIFKFRTMVPGAETLPPDAESHKPAADPRITRIGRILRRTSLDELPQFFNVLKGEMTLVGPRPELPAIVELYEPWQRQRFTVPPGITGWWQVSGRSEKLMHLNTEDDLYYIKNYSLFLDLQILVKTVWVVFRGEGAW